MGGAGLFYRFKGGGGGVEKHCTRASLHSDSGRPDQSQCRGGALEHPFIQTQWKI